MQIVVRHFGGLGNQLFQYAAGRYFAKKYGASLRIAVEREERLSSHGQPRPFLLPKFAISAGFRQISTLERLLLSISPRIELATRPIRALRNIDVVRETHPQVHVFDPSLTIAAGTRTAYLVGMWQCYPPVEMIAEDLRTELSFREPPGGQNIELARTIQTTPNAVSVHLRRGDYAIEYPHAVLSTDYYQSAIQQMRDRLGNATFFVFSDEVAFAREFAANHSDCVVVTHNSDESAHEDLRLMSLCQHHIIANSTFSWWGAWLNPRKEKEVILPRKWVRFDTSEIQIALPGWGII
ncbi:MAG: alpha-1,2-fucosyltransferase [Acidobacteriota bacterium]|nr:alpha-1,2-fucosyltransferase [Acidobacteriota bacterium]